MKAQGARWFWVLVMALVLGWFGSQAAAEKVPSEDKAAVVNGSVITKADLDREVSRSQQRPAGMGKPLTGSQVSEIRKRVLKNLIDRELLYQESQKKGIKVDEAEVNERFKVLKKRFPGEAEFQEWLSKMDLSEAGLKSLLGQNMAIQKLIDKHLKITVSDKEMKAYYDSHPDSFKRPEQVRASHILIKVDPKADESQKAEARKKLEKILQKLQKGGDFAALAKESSECPSSAKGGDLGYFGRGQMAKPFEDMAFAKKPGEFSEIVETKFGYHVIKVVDKKPATEMPFEDVKDRLEKYLMQEKYQKEVGLYVEKLKKKAKIQTF